MRTKHPLRQAAAVAASLILLSATNALAGGHRHHDIEGEIDDLDANMRFDGRLYQLVVDYEIEIDDAPRGEQFELILRIQDRKCSVPGLEPAKIVVPLGRPCKIDDDEIEYRGRIRIGIDPRSVHDPKHLRLEGYLVHRGSNRSLDHEGESVDFDR